MDIDIVIATWDRVSLLNKCLCSLEEASFKGMNINVFIIINGEDRKSEEFLEKACFPNLNLRVFPITKTFNGAARNAVFDKLEGQWTFFIDDDAWVPKTYFQDFFNIIKNAPEIDILGGSDCADTTGRYHQRMLNALYSSVVAMGPTWRRHTVINKDKLIKASERDLTLCHLWVKTRFLKENDLKFPIFLMRNEENYFLNEAQKFKANIFYSYQLKVNHLRRKRILALLSTIFSSGQSRFAMIMAQNSAGNLLYFTPLFCISLAVFFPVTFFVKQLFLLYLFLVLIASIKMAFVFRVFKAIPILIALHPAIHISYAVGMLSYPINQINNFVQTSEVKEN